MSTTEIDPSSFEVPENFRPLLNDYLRELLRYQVRLQLGHACALICSMQLKYIMDACFCLSHRLPTPTLCLPILTTQPEDIPSFSRDYFASLAEGRLDAFLRSQRDRMIAIAGPGTGGYKTLQDYALPGQSVTARAPAPEDEDPTEREIREMGNRSSNGLSAYSTSTSTGAQDQSKSLRSYDSGGFRPRGGVHEAYSNDRSDEEMLQLQARLREMEGAQK